MSGMVLVQEAITVAFFLPSPIHKVATSLRRACDEYFALIPDGALRWASVGANSHVFLPFKSTTLRSCRAQLSPTLTKKRTLTAFDLKDTGHFYHGGSVVADARSHGLLVIGGRRTQGRPDELSLMQMTFPSEMVHGDRAEEFVDNMCKIASALPIVSGYASPGLQLSEYGGYTARSRSWDILSRYPGYDVENNESGRHRLGTRVRGARWLTFIGPTILKKLGGAQSLQRTLGAQIETRPIGRGLLVRAGHVPEIGDTLYDVGTPRLNSVAEALRPVTAFGEGEMRAYFAQDDDFHHAWDRRFVV